MVLSDEREPVFLSLVRAFGVLVRDVGFPAVVAGFVLWRVDASVRDLVLETVRTRMVLVELVRRSCPAVGPDGSVGEPGVRRPLFEQGERSFSAVPRIAACGCGPAGESGLYWDAVASGYEWMGGERCDAAAEGPPRWVFTQR